MLPLRGCKVHEQVGVRCAVVWQRPAMNAFCALVQNHLARRHVHAVHYSVNVRDEQGPRHVVSHLRNVDDGADHMGGQSVDMRMQDTAGLVRPNAVRRGGLELHASPVFQRLLHGCEKLSAQVVGDGHKKGGHLSHVDVIIIRHMTFMRPVKRASLSATDTQTHMIT